MKNIISTTFTDRMRLVRTVYNGVNAVDSVVYDDVPCALSRSAHTHSPTPMSGDSQLPHSSYRLRLYAAPEITFMLGDRVEVTRNGRVFAGIASDSFYYDSHSVCVVTIEEVRD